MARRSTNNPRSKNSGFVEHMTSLDLRHLKSDGVIKDGELKVYERGQLLCGLVLADLRHGPQYFNRLVLFTRGVRQIIALQCRPTNFGGHRWYMLDLNDRRNEIFYLRGDYYGSRRDIGAIQYLSQSEPMWARLRRKMRAIELKLGNLPAEGKIAANHRCHLQSELWQAQVDFERAIERDGALVVEKILTTRVTKSGRQKSSKERLELFERAMQFNTEPTASNVIISRYEPFLCQIKRASANRHLAIATGTSKIGKDSPIAAIELRFLRFLGLCNPGMLTGRELGWPPGWLQREGRRLYFLIDRQVAGEDCVLFVTHDEGQQPVAQFFWIREGKGAFEKPQLFFWDPQRDHVTDCLRFSHSGFRYHTDDVPKGDDWDLALAEQEAERLQSTCLDTSRRRA